MAENHLPQGDDVAQQENNGFGPLLKRRGKTAIVASVIAVVIVGAMLLFTVKGKGKEEEFPSPVFTVSLQTLNVVLGEMIRRLFLLSEEFRHRHSRYRGKWKRVFQEVFPFNYCKRVLVAAIVSTFIVCCHQLYERYEILSRPDFVILFFLNSFLVNQLSQLVGLRQPSPMEISDLNEKENKNVAYGLAWGYYVGYLKLVLPRLRYQIEESALFGDEVDKKLFILVPRTCFVCGDVDEADSRVKFAGQLTEMKTSRCGITERVYKQRVYMIEKTHPNGIVVEHYLLVEYATPLMALYDMSFYVGASLSREERDYQVW